MRRLGRLLLWLSVLTLGWLTAAVHAAENVVILKVGHTRLSSPAQSVLGVPVRFDPSSNGVLSVEYERRFAGGMAVGGEFIGYGHDYYAGGLVGKANARLLFANLKRYLGGTMLHPFVGGGLGAVSLDMSGPINGTGGDVALQLMAGAELQLGAWGVEVELKHIAARPEDVNHQTIDVSADSVWVGASFHF